MVPNVPFNLQRLPWRCRRALHLLVTIALTVWRFTYMVVCLALIPLTVPLHAAVVKQRRKPTRKPKKRKKSQAPTFTPDTI